MHLHLAALASLQVLKDLRSDSAMGKLFPFSAGRSQQQVPDLVVIEV
jgi:hypothetical protein